MSWGAVASIGGSLIAGYLGKKNSNSASSSATSPAYYDPYAVYRPNAAQQLNRLMQDPSTVNMTPEYSARLQAAQRLAASQGYNGSGNALVAAADAGGQAYQQAFNNLATISGAAQSPANAAMLASNQGNYNQQMSNQMWGNLGGLFGRLGSSLGNSFNSGDTGWGIF